MKYSYRVTKYKADDLGGLRSLPDEWTSFYDIGSKITEDGYAKIERQYIEYVVDACNCLSVKSLGVQGLEVNANEFQYEEGAIINIADLGGIIQSILREEIWCKLVSRECEFHFGYDFYMYFLCDDCPQICVEQIKTELTVQKYESPY